MTQTQVNLSAGVATIVDISDPSNDEITLLESLGIVTVSDPNKTLLAAGSATQNGSDVEISTAGLTSFSIDLAGGRNILTATSVTEDLTITGGSGYSTIKSGSGADVINGGSGKNKIEGGAGADNLDGEGGRDTVEYTNSDAAVTVDLSTSTASGGHAQGDTIANFENVSGSVFNDALTGDNGNNIIRGRAGSDTIVGGDGNDRLFVDEGDDDIQGGAGNDFIRGGAGADTIDGGADIDTVHYINSNTRVKVYLNKGTGSLGHAAGDTFVGVENVEGSDFDDLLSGDGARNILKGHEGDDTILGQGGGDVLIGGLGNDTITGGRGADTLTGGAGNDTFVTTNFRDSRLGEIDRIEDFEIGQDQIQGLNAITSTDIDQLGSISGLKETSIQNLLTEIVFEAQTGATFMVASRTFLALNDNTAGFQASKDVIIDITGYTGSLSSLSVIA